MVFLKVLNCESMESTYESIEQITDISKETLDLLFSKLDVDKYYKNPNFNGEGYNIFLKHIKKISTKKNISYDYVSWFHLSRVQEIDSFKNGILPLDKMIDNLWDFLYKLQKDFLSKKEWEEFRYNFENVDQSLDSIIYRSKLSSKDGFGPFAMLIKEASIKHREIGNHDYLDCPEIIEDICNAFMSKHAFNLLKSFKNNTKPCIIKFIDKNAKKEYLGRAVSYLYYKYHNDNLSKSSNTCFVGKGNIILPDLIQSMEFVDYK
jgi:hypothetical protein